MKRFSDKTIRAICKIDAETLAEKKIVTPARVGYICPECGNGEGHDGTGITPKMTDDFLKWWCPRCGENFNNLRIFSERYGFDLRSEFAPLVEKICADFNIKIEYENADSPRTSRRRHNQNATKADTPVNPAELAEIRADLNTNPDDLTTFVKFSCYTAENKWRGLPIDLLLQYGCRYVAKWMPPKSRAENKKSTPTARILIPCSDSAYLARLVNPIEEFDEQTRQYIHEKEHAGKKTLFNPADLNSDEVVICVEGYVDCLSLIYTGFKSVALGGAKEYNKLVNAVKKMTVKPRILILLDSDDTGRENAPKLHDELLKIGCACCIRYLFDDVTKTDCNDILIRDGVDNLRGRLESIMDSSLAELDGVTRELEERQLHRHDDALIDFLFQGDASDLDFARRFEKFFGDSVRWVKDVEEWILFERDENGGAVWQRHGEKNSCLLPRVRQMADVMLEYAENSDERELAEKLKRTRKNLSSITMLKSLDSILITAEDLDRHKEFLNVRNGVIDLTTGKLMTAEPSLLLTQTAAAVFNPNCADKTFAEFFKSILPDDETRAVIERFLGYALTAEVSAEKFLLISGEGANGKGTLLLTLRTLLKDFAVELPPDAVLENRGRLTADANGRATPELNGLAKRRLGVIDELPRNGRVDVAKLKRLTGGDYLPIRHLHHEYIEIAPTHKIIMCGNYRPQLDDARDVAFLRRLIAVKFEQDFSQNPDETLKEKLLADSALTGALNVLVPAAVMWYRDGLLKPSALMNQARQTYLDENDFVGDFLAEYYTFDEKLSTPRKALIKHLREQCADATRYRDADLCTMVAKVNGVTYRQIRNAWIFQGIGLKKQQDAKDEFDREILSSADFIPPPN